MLGHLGLGKQASILPFYLKSSAASLLHLVVSFLLHQRRKKEEVTPLPSPLPLLTAAATRWTGQDEEGEKWDKPRKIVIFYQVINLVDFLFLCCFGSVQDSAG